MATQPEHPAPLARPTQLSTERGPGVLKRWRAHRAARQQERLVSARNRRVLARWLRRTANHVDPPHLLVSRREALMHCRAAAVRTELLEIAALLEHARDPDPAHVTEIRELLANGCDSPLYNADIHVSELHAALYYLRAALIRPTPARATPPSPEAPRTRTEIEQPHDRDGLTSPP